MARVPARGKYKGASYAATQPTPESSTGSSPSDYQAPPQHEHSTNGLLLVGVVNVLLPGVTAMTAPAAADTPRQTILVLSECVVDVPIAADADDTFTGGGSSTSYALPAGGTVVMVASATADVWRCRPSVA